MSYQIIIEVCSNCKQHAWCTRHNEATYLALAEELKRTIISHLNNVSVKINLVGDYKIGSFQVICKGITLFSKLQLGYFPHTVLLTNRIVSFIEDVKQGNDLSKYKFSHSPIKNHPQFNKSPSKSPSKQNVQATQIHNKSLLNLQASSEKQESHVNLNQKPKPQSPVKPKQPQVKKQDTPVSKNTQKKEEKHHQVKIQQPPKVKQQPKKEVINEVKVQKTQNKQTKQHSEAKTSEKQAKQVKQVKKQTQTHDHKTQPKQKKEVINPLPAHQPQEKHPEKSQKAISHKEVKQVKEVKEVKEIKEVKEAKEVKEVKEATEAPKQVTKEAPKQATKVEATKEAPKQATKVEAPKETHQHKAQAVAQKTKDKVSVENPVLPQPLKEHVQPHKEQKKLSVLEPKKEKQPTKQQTAVAPSHPKDPQTSKQKVQSPKKSEKVLPVAKVQDAPKAHDTHVQKQPTSVGAVVSSEHPVIQNKVESEVTPKKKQGDQIVAKQ